MKSKSLAFWIIFPVLLGCVLLSITTMMPLLTKDSITTNRCGLPYTNFSENDILGTWKAQRLDDKDTLIIRKDGMYKQIISISNPQIHLEGDWEHWHLTYSENNTPYVHLENLRLCVAEQGVIDCSSVGGGEREWYDLCSDKWVTMPEKGVLAVINTSDRSASTPRLELFLFPLSIENPWVYHLEGP